MHANIISRSSRDSEALVATFPSEPIPLLGDPFEYLIIEIIIEDSGFCNVEEGLILPRILKNNNPEKRNLRSQ